MLKIVKKKNTLKLLKKIVKKYVNNKVKQKKNVN